MIVSRLGQGAGAVHSAPRSKAPPNARPAAPAQLFDANGDGVIENWSVLHGGDSFTTLDPAPPGSEPAPVHHAAAPPAGTATHHVSSPHAIANGTPAAIHHAQDAYQRDGLADTRVTSAPAPAADAAAPGTSASPAPPMPQGEAVAHLPSTG
jgi:hypothetical protein